MMQKFCQRCNTTKLIIEFSLNRSKKSGYADWCKSCTSAHEKKPEQTERARLRRRRWISIPDNREKLQQWRKLPESRRIARERTARERIIHKDKVWARDQAYLAIRRGDLKRQPCEVCQSEKTDAHHDDYAKPFDVRWLCRKHHVGVHAKYAA